MLKKVLFAGLIALSVPALAEPTPIFKMKKYVGGLKTTGTSQGGGSGPVASTLTATPSTVNFGIFDGDVLSGSVVLQATGGDVALSSVTPPPYVSVASTTCGATLPAGQSCQVFYQYEPTQGSPALNSVLTYGSSSDTVAVTLQGSAPELGRLTATTAEGLTLAFGVVNLGSQSVAKVVTLANAGGLPYQFTEPACPTNWVCTHDCNSTMEAGTQCAMTLVFAPQSAGVKDTSYTLGDKTFQLTGAGAGDPNIGQVGALLHFDGTPGSLASVADLGTMTTSSVLLSATNRFGGSSAQFNGATSLALANNAMFAFGTNDFTIEFWINGSGAQDQMLFDFRNAGANNHIHVTVGGYGGSTPGGIRYVSGSGGPTLATTSNIMNGQWHHVAVVRYSSVTTIYVDGVSSASGADNVLFQNVSGSVHIGKNSYGDSSKFNGYLDEVRITKGTARYTGNFTPPASAFYTN